MAAITLHAKPLSEGCSGIVIQVVNPIKPCSAYLLMRESLQAVRLRRQHEREERTLILPEASKQLRQDRKDRRVQRVQTLGDVGKRGVPPWAVPTEPSSADHVAASLLTRPQRNAFPIEVNSVCD